MIHGLVNRKKRILSEGLAAMGLATGGAGHGDDHHHRHLHAEHNEEGEADDGTAYLRDWTMVCLGSASQPLLNWGLGPLFAVLPPFPAAATAAAADQASATCGI
jgi:hypothetical protein